MISVTKQNVYNTLVLLIHTTATVRCATIQNTQCHGPELLMIDYVPYKLLLYSEKINQFQCSFSKQTTIMNTIYTWCSRKDAKTKVVDI